MLEILYENQPLSILKLFVSTILLLISLPNAIAQEEDTLRSFRPSGIRVGTDLLVLGKSFYKEGFYGWELVGDIDFYKYLLVAEFGGSGRELMPKGNGLFSNNGTYFRIGADINFLHADPEGNMLLFGFRYGRSIFNEDLQIVSSDPFWGDQTFNLQNRSVNGRWLELTTGLRVRLFKYFLMGYTARFKFFPKSTGEGELISYEIPGYGIKDLNLYWGFNYQLFINVPLKKQQ